MRLCWDKAILEYSPSYPAFKFPMKVGNRWSGSYSGFRADKNTRWNSTVNFEVTAYEEIIIPAGKIMAYKIEYTDIWKSGSYSGGDTVTVWYSPEVGYNVKLKHSDSLWNHELVGFHRQ